MDWRELLKFLAQGWDSGLRPWLVLQQQTLQVNIGSLFVVTPTVFVGCAALMVGLHITTHRLIASGHLSHLLQRRYGRCFVSAGPNLLQTSVVTVEFHRWITDPLFALITTVIVTIVIGASYHRGISRQANALPLALEPATS